MDNIIHFEDARFLKDRQDGPLYGYESTEDSYNDLLSKMVRFTCGEITIARTGCSRIGPTYDPRIVDGPGFNERWFSKLLRYVDSVWIPGNYHVFTAGLDYGTSRRLFTSIDMFRFLQENPRVDFHLQLFCNPWEQVAVMLSLNEDIDLREAAEQNLEEFEEPMGMTENAIVFPLPRIRTKEEPVRLRPIEDVRYERYEKKREENKAWDPYWGREPPEWTRIEHGDL